MFSQRGAWCCHTFPHDPLKHLELTTRLVINRMYENQKLLYIVPLIRPTIVVCINSISLMTMECFICVNMVIVHIDISEFVMSGVLVK